MNKKLSDRAKQLLRVVDDSGSETGETVERWKAHSSPGVKHLAFLVFVVNGKGQLVLHKRSPSKIGGDTIDSPVSHVLAEESLEEAVHRCLLHEYGVKENLPLLDFGGFSYEKDYGDGTCENEYCLSLAVRYCGKVKPNPGEMNEKLILVPVKKAIADCRAHPAKYAVWFCPAAELLSNGWKDG